MKCLIYLNFFRRPRTSEPACSRRLCVPNVCSDEMEAEFFQVGHLHNKIIITRRRLPVSVTIDRVIGRGRGGGGNRIKKHA